MKIIINTVNLIMCLFVASVAASQSYYSIDSPWLRYQTHSLSEQVVNVWESNGKILYLVSFFPLTLKMV